MRWGQWRPVIFGLAVVVILTAGGYWWLSQLWPPSPEDSLKSMAPATVAGQACGLPAAESVPADRTTALQDHSMKAEELIEGQTLRWQNNSDEPATIQSVSHENRPACAGFAATTLQPGDELRFTFLRQGNWFFKVDDGEMITVVVKASL